MRRYYAALDGAARHPYLMLHGVKDPLVPIANVDYLRAQLTAAGKSNLFDTLVYPDYNHFIPWEHPDAVKAAIRKITSLPGDAPKNR